jgi:hypothetical protein
VAAVVVVVAAAVAVARESEWPSGLESVSALLWPPGESA